MTLCTMGGVVGRGEDGSERTAAHPIGILHDRKQGRAPFGALPIQPDDGRLPQVDPDPYRVASVALICPQVDGAVWGGAAAA
jgi:hypothetical protein